MDDLTQYRRLIESTGGSTAGVDALVEAILSGTDESALVALFARLRVEAGKIDWLLDSDYAAIALQAAIGRSESPGLRRAMLAVAIERAEWCARCSTAGGEGLARSQHVRELEALRSRIG